MFASKVWAFDNPCGPLVFKSAGYRNNAARRLKAGDRVILIGTRSEKTPVPDRNRVLGMMEPSTVQVATSDFIVPDHADRRLFREDGSYRWPYGLLNYRAWQFAPGLFLDAVAPRKGNPFGTAAATGIVPLTGEEEARVLAHLHHEIPLLQSIGTELKLYGEDEARRRNAPRPTEGARRSIMQMRSGRAYVYWFRLETNGKTVGHKIGWAFDWKQRLRQFNMVALSALGGLRYEGERFQLLDTARLAFHVEQKLLRNFNAHRHRSNREVVTGIEKKALEDAWRSTIVAAKLGES